MIDIKEKYNCCGCGACVQVCPKQCISMSADNEGFLYPQVDTAICIDCGLCEKVCPVINQNEPREPLAVYAAKNNNEEIRLKSSSGGIFTLLAEQIISEGGVVFGARFNDNWDVVHDYTETINGLEAFRGSKYVQSIIGDNFKIAKQFLNDGRKVLFSGTPCQIAGLKNFLREEYDNLFTVDVVCHGVPSPMVWCKYKDEIKAQPISPEENFTLNHSQISLYSVNFREKSNGWKNYMCTYSVINTSNNHTNTLTYEHTIDPYMRLFLSNYSLRPSCYYCPGKEGKSRSDVTLGDCWGLEKVKQNIDNKGYSLILTFSNRIPLKNDILSGNISMLHLKKYNSAYYISPKFPKYRDAFWRDLAKGYNVSFLASKYKLTPSLKAIIKLVLNKFKLLYGIVKSKCKER